MTGSNRGERNKTLATIGLVSFVITVGAMYFWMFYDMGASSARYRVEQEQAGKAYTKDATKEVSAECVGSDTPATCQREIEQANAEGRRTQEDLEAQRGMSKWAFWLLVISAFQFPATLAALVFVKRTLDATLDAVEETKTATLAMQRQNEIAEDTAKRQLRPYVAITETTEPDEKPFSRDTILKFVIKNFGMTPATNVRISLGEAFHSEPLGDFSVPLKKSGEYGLMAPNDSRTERIYATGLSFKELETIADRKLKFILRLRIDYAWPGGKDFHDMTVVLDDPSKNGWSLVDDRRRHCGHQQG
jgi:hypothetical protein